MNRRFVRPRELADLLGISEKTVRRRIRTGAIPSTRIEGGRSIVIPESFVDTLLQRSAERLPVSMAEPERRQI